MLFKGTDTTEVPLWMEWTGKVRRKHEDVTFFQVDGWMVTSAFYSERDRRYYLTASKNDDTIRFDVSDVDILFARTDSEVYRVLMHAHQDALNTRQQLRDEMDQFRGKGYW